MGGMIQALRRVPAQGAVRGGRAVTEPRWVSSLLLGGQNREFAEHVGDVLRRHLPAYDVLTDLDSIPAKLRGQHDRNPVKEEV